MKKIIPIIFAFLLLSFMNLSAQEFSMEPLVSSSYVAIYPNPTHQPYFFIKTSQIITKVEIIDLVGNKIYYKNFNSYYSETTKIVLPNRTKRGLYLVKIYFDDNTSVIRKLIYK